MKNHLLATGVFVFAALLLFTLGFFMIGSENQLFTHHVDLYTRIGDISGITTGTSVRISGFAAGQVTKIEIPISNSPNPPKFKLVLHIDDKLLPLIHSDSYVTVETVGIVGEKFLMVHPGSENAPLAQPGTVLSSREQVQLSDMAEKVSTSLDKVNSSLDLTTNAIADLQTRVDASLGTINSTVTNANGMVTDLRNGKGTLGLLLNDPQTEAQVKSAIANAMDATTNLDKVSVQAGQLMTDFQSRNLIQKADDTLTYAKDASKNLDQTSQQVNATVTNVLGPDVSGQNAGQHIRDSLTNLDLFTQNMSDDTEALKHEFFFRGFFRKRGYYSLQNVAPEEYRTSRYFQSPKSQRVWLAAGNIFAPGPNNSEVISPAGAAAIDQAVTQRMANTNGTHSDGSLVAGPIMIEGYSNQPSAADQLATSSSRAQLVARYLQERFHLSARFMGLMPLNNLPPASSGKSIWDGVCIVLLPPEK